MPNESKNIELRSEEINEILTKPPHWLIRRGNILFLTLIILLLSLSWVIKYPDIIISETIVTTQIPPQKEYANITGKLDSIYVNDLQKVNQNTILAVIENAARTEDLYFLKSIIDTITLDNNSIWFPLDSLPILFLGNVEESFAAFENNYFQYTLNKQLKPFNNEAIANRISLAELRGRLKSLKAQYDFNESELELKKNNLKRNKALFEKGVISNQEYEDKQLEMLTAERDFENLSISISQIREAISGARKTSKGTEINKTRENLKLLKASLQSFTALQSAIEDWENKYVLKSEINGTVSFLNFWDKNQTVKDGDLVFIIIPSENSNYVAKVKAPSQNSGKIKIGQKVNIKLRNFPDSEFGVLKGKVSNISLAPDRDGFYLIDVSLPRKLITSYNKDIGFKQEMRGNAEIITEDLRLLERFFYQFRELLER